MKALLERVRDELGAMGCAAALLLVAAAAFHSLVLQPMQERRAALHGELAQQSRKAADEAPARAAAGQLDALYRSMERAERTPDWLATLYAIGKETGLGLQSATYRSHPGAGRLERYEIVLPMSGSYPQVREFVARALAEVPVVSLDRFSLKRGETTAAAVQAEVHMTLHTVKP